jgi:hypothetical protein
MQVKAIQEGFRKRITSQEEIYQDRPPRETELLRTALKARSGQDILVTHPVIEAFVHFKWLTVRRFFFLIRSVYVRLNLIVIIQSFRETIAKIQ